MPENCYLFLGVSINNSPILTFGDKSNNNSVFIAANYQESAGNELSQLIYLEHELFQSWISDGGSPPKSEEWILISFLDWQVNPDLHHDQSMTTSFETITAFQTGCALFIQHCANLRDQNDPICALLLLIVPTNDDDHDDEDEHAVEIINEHAVEFINEQSTEVKRRRRNDPNAQPSRASDRLFTHRLNQDNDDDPSFQLNRGDTDFKMPTRGRKPPAAKKKASSTGKKNASGTKKNNNPLAPPARRTSAKSQNVDDTFIAGADILRSMPPKPPMVFTTPVVSTAAPVTSAPAYTFEVGMAQQDRILDFLERSANFVFDKAERYKFG